MEDSFEKKKNGQTVFYANFSKNHKNCVFYLLKKKYNEIFSENNLDVLILPTSPTFPLELPKDLDASKLDVYDDVINHSLGSIENTCQWNLCGFPSLTIPVKSSSKGLPIGMQIVSRFNNDKLCVRVASNYEKIKHQYFNNYGNS